MHLMWARDTEAGPQASAKYPKARPLETSDAMDDILNCFQKERPQSAQKSSTQHLWALSSPERWVQLACVFLPLQYSGNVLTAGIELLPVKGIFGSFLAFEKGPSHSASVVGESWQKQAHLSALFCLQQGRSRD